MEELEPLRIRLLTQTASKKVQRLAVPVVPRLSSQIRQSVVRSSDRDGTLLLWNSGGLK